MNIAVLGYGTVGSGVVEVIEKNKKEVCGKAGQEINIKYVLDLRDFPGDPIQDRIVHDVNVIMEDASIEIVCEVMGGVEPAYTFVKRALTAGKSVCTSNKELVAKHGPELIALAKEKNCNFLFEASVGGGIPIIRPINSSLTPERIEEVTGILNGTTNYILSKMAREGLEYEDVLKEAQELGYAERNPAADVEGFDACRKIAILSSLVYGYNVNYEDIHTEGITHISATDIAYAEKMGLAIKLLGTSRSVDGVYYALVAPFLLKREHPLYNVNDVLNAILVRGNMLGDTMYYGSGAGKLPTASAVVSDVIDAARHPGKHITCQWNVEPLQLADHREARSRFFVRVKGNAADTAEMQKLFGSVTPVSLRDAEGEYGFITQEMSGKEYEANAEKTDSIINMIRVMD